MLNLSVLWSIAEINSAGKSASPKAIHRETGYSMASVYRALKELRGAKMILRYKHGQYVCNGNSPLYQSLNDAFRVLDNQQYLFRT